MVNILSIAYAVRTASQSTSFPLKLSAAQQIVASALGHKSLAGFQASYLESSSMADAVHFILDLDLLSNRAQQLNLPNSQHELNNLIQTGIKEFLPKAQFHTSMNDLYNYVIYTVDSIALNDNEVVSQMAMTNGDGLDEVYLPVDDFELGDLPPPMQQLYVDLKGHISMNIDTERPYFGHKIFVHAMLTLERTGKVSMAEPTCEILNAKLDYGWSDDESDEPNISLAEAFVQEFDLELSEAETLVDADHTTNQSNDDFVYGHTFDFRDHAPPKVAKKLIEKYGSLIIDVPAWFFDNVNNEW